MKAACFSAVFLTIASSAVAASSATAALEWALETLPHCGLECLEAGILQSTCSATNATCICTNEPLNAEVELCVSSSCSVENALTTKNITQTACGATPRDRSTEVSYVGVVGGAIALLAVVLRVIARLPCMGGGFGLDDYVLLATLIPMIPLTILSVFLADFGLGKDMWTVPFKDITKILYYYYWDEGLYLSSLALTKISICCFYLRIFPQQRFRIFVYICMACCAIYGVSFVVAVWLQCSPLNLAWTAWSEPGLKAKCVNVNALGWTSASFNIALDLFVISLPMPQLLKLALSWRKKIHVMIMFGVGFFVTVVSMLRLKWMIQFSNSTNVTWDYVPIGYWSTIEVHASILCASLPAIRALMLQLFPRSFGHSSALSGGFSSNGPKRSYGNSISGSKEPLHSGIGANVHIVQRISKADQKEFIPLEDFEEGEAGYGHGVVATRHGDVEVGRRADGVKDDGVIVQTRCFGP
ncbi:hypothetical protein K490DRAFT_62671 [Saccharata proteae CBS 121410]|uniref:CFEM domain-containing protein n=1 Tax=Saccharata proteae CBS 121410 TaxID=1314787 RepID=A0A9P4HZI5_9PEZI|nr:hypothetical protein K490DRAFT_62671 [Saccharata proteae CBS 121410]